MAALNVIHKHLFSFLVMMDVVRSVCEWVWAWTPMEWWAAVLFPLQYNGLPGRAVAVLKGAVNTGVNVPAAGGGL